MASKAAMALRLARLSSWVPSLAQIVFTPEDGLQIVNVTAFLLCRDQSVRGGRFPLFWVAVFECTTRPFSRVPRRWFLPVPQGRR